MWVWALRRFLLMIPTIFGISLINFALINIGDPQRTTSVDPEGKVDPSKSVEAGEAERIFRQTFNLDKPVFLNTRYGLEDGEILWRLATPLRAYALPVQKKENLEALEDYGRTIVPHLVRIAKAAEARDAALRADYEARWAEAREVWLAGDRPLGDVAWPPPTAPPPFDEAFHERVLELSLHRLYANAPRRARVKYSGALDPEDEAYNREVRGEQRELKLLFLRSLEGPEGRREALAGWVRWYGERRAEWDYSFGDKASMLFLETRFARYWAKLLTWDLGDSFQYRTPVSRLILDRLHISLRLAFGSLLLAYLIAVPLGILSAVTHRSASDRVISFVLFALYSFPTMFLGVLLRDHVATDLGWFPVSGFQGADWGEMTVVQKFWDRVHHCFLPLLTLTLISLASLSRYMKAGLIETIRADFVRTARAKGLSEFVVVMRHAVRNSLIPIVTLLGASLPVVIGGSVVIEVIFDIDGMGKLGWQAVLRKDYSVILGINIIAAALTMIGVFLTDLFYAMLDPRITYK
jgi:ABC-type dipeptide/oligopeptide/nickel transport system permease component